MKAPGNSNKFRESWLHAATDELRPYFASVGYPLPDKIRFAIAFTSTGRKGKRQGECWHSSTSDDATYEIFIRPDLSQPPEVLAVLVKELVHTTLPSNAGHGKLFKTAAQAVGFHGRMRDGTPGVLLKNRLDELAASLGPLPHASLHIDRDPLASIAVDRPKKQKGRMLKAHCDGDGCGYTLRVPLKWVRDPGPPHCPKHGAMTVDMPPDILGHPNAPEQTQSV